MRKQAYTEQIPILTLEQQYRRNLATLPQLSKQEEWTLLQRAQADEHVRDEIVLSLQQSVYAMATKYAARDKTIDCMDLVQEANMAMLSRFDYAITKHNPFAYLLQVAKLTMIDCINGRGALIRTYRYEEKVCMVSLDQPIDEDGQTLTDTPPAAISSTLSRMPEEASLSLRQAVEALPQRHRMVIERHYGMGEHKPVSLNAVSWLLSPKSQRPSLANYYHKIALTMLNAALTPVFPQYSAGGVQ